MSLGTSPSIFWNDWLNKDFNEEGTAFSEPIKFAVPSARLVVREWLDTHADHPYPTTKEKTDFARSWNLTFRQIATLFNNERRRYMTDNCCHR